MIAVHHGAAFFRRLGSYMTEGVLRPPASTSPASSSLGANGVLLCDGIPLGDEIVELAAAVARGGYPGTQQGRTEFDAGKVNMHFPKTRQEGFAFCVHRDLCRAGS